MRASRVIIVEGDPALKRALVATVSSTKGLEVVADAGTLGAARRVLETPADLLLLDPALPDGSGRTLFAPARARGLSVLVLTALGGDDVLFEAIRAGVAGYCHKTEPVAIGEALLTLVKGGAPVTPKIARRLLDALSGECLFNQSAPPAACLTPREEEMMELFALGATYTEVAVALAMSVNTVREHVRRAYQKLHACSKAEAVAAFLATRPPAPRYEGVRAKGR